MSTESQPGDEWERRTQLFRACPTCGASVATEDVEKHTRWHDGIAKTARDADYAAAMFRPLA